MPQIEQSWTPLAHSLGFTNEVEMLIHFYEHQHLSIREIAIKLKVSRFSVTRRLRRYVTIRPSGGPNNIDKRYLRNAPNDELMSSKIKDLARKYHVNPTTIYRERRIRRELNKAITVREWWDFNNDKIKEGI